MSTTQQADEIEHTPWLTELRQALLAWFDTSARDLPWRRTRDPYRILVSEIMLQQTQVDRVIPKYLAFLELFPTVAALAQAPTAQVIQAWSGLGYNRRAVNLQRTARVVHEELQGEFPRDVTALLALPGIGPYTAGAVACFAFEQDVAFMDTNIRRVVHRVFVGNSEPPPSETQLLELARVAIPAGQGWTWNQAIMELGALICTANTPQCWRCPLQAHCRDYAQRRASDEQLFSQAVADTTPVRTRRAVAERRDTRYVGSNRYYRGRIIETVRGLAAGQLLPLHELGPQIHESFSADDMDWLRKLVDGLVRDGLLVHEADGVRLPD